MHVTLPGHTTLQLSGRRYFKIIFFFYFNFIEFRGDSLVVEREIAALSFIDGPLLSQGRVFEPRSPLFFFFSFAFWVFSTRKCLMSYLSTTPRKVEIIGDNFAEIRPPLLSLLYRSQNLAKRSGRLVCR